METFKEMVYQKDRCDSIVLADGSYKNHRYIVKSLGTHPTAYVQLNNSDLMYIELIRNAHNDPEEVTYDDFPIECHGGLTYYSDQLYVGNRGNVPGHLIAGHWVGWDYAHCEDYCGYDYDNPYFHTKKWTTKEMIAECKNVIDQVVEYNYKEE